MFVLFDIGDSVERGFDTFFEWLPNLVGALVVLIIGWIVAKIVQGAVSRGLQRAGFDRTATSGQAGEWVRRVTGSPSQLAGRFAWWAIFLGTLSIAASVLGVQAIEDFVAAVWAYIPNVIAAVLIFLVAGAISAGVVALVGRTMGDTALGKLVATAAPIIVMSIAIFMILEQLEIAPEIVRITYMGLIGAIALGAALAFGLGGREVAARILEGAYQAGQEKAPQLRADAELAKERAQTTADALRERAGAQTSGPSA